jgi:hypothetical protein
MNIDIIKLIDLYFSKKYDLFLKISGVYIQYLDCYELSILHNDIYWNYILDNIDYCDVHIIKFIKLLHLQK